MSRNRSSLIEQFQRVLSDCGLFDLGFQGPKFTYSNRRQGCQEVKCRLDRVVADADWISKYHDATVLHLNSHHSDHRPILLKLCKRSDKSGSLFRFEMMWMRDPNFVEQLKKNWAKGSNSRTLNDKLKMLSAHLKRWNKKSFGNVNGHLKKLKEELECVRQQPRCSTSIEKERCLVSELDEWLAREEQMWAQRSRISWLSEGDNNTRFFHLKANARKRANSAVELMDHEGRIHTNQSDIERIVLNYFGNIFNSVQDLTNDEISLHLNCVPRKVGARQNELLNEQYTEREVTCALFQLYPSKAPGLDGFPAEFFQKYWNVVKTDFIAACLSFLNEGVLPYSMNDTLIVLIPKL